MRKVILWCSFMTLLFVGTHALEAMGAPEGASGSSGGGSGTQLVTMLVTFILISVPLAILNSSIARRKGRSGAKFGWLSIIPGVAVLLAIYLVSLTDKAIIEKLDQVLKNTEKTGVQ